MKSNKWKLKNIAKSGNRNAGIMKTLVGKVLLSIMVVAIVLMIIFAQSANIEKQRANRELLMVADEFIQDYNAVALDVSLIQKTNVSDEISKVIRRQVEGYNSRKETILNDLRENGLEESEQYKTLLGVQEIEYN